MKNASNRRFRCSLVRAETLNVLCDPNSLVTPSRCRRTGRIAESLIEGGQEWEKTAVDCARRNMKHSHAIGGYHGDFEAAVDAREMANTHAMLATALLHAVDEGNSHYRCDLATCEKARERASKLREQSELSGRTMILTSPLRHHV
jgi:hypothetical protein